MNIQIESADALSDYARHLKNLSPEDRYTRFCYHIKDESIDSFILNILYNQNDHVLFSATVNGQRVGFVHLAREGADWELAVSVDSQHQQQGIADSLLSHAVTWSATHGIHAVYMHCITQYTKIQHLARKHGLRVIERDGTEVTSKIELPQATVVDYTAEFLKEQRDLYRQIQALQRQMVQNLNPYIFIKEHTLDQ
jgi:GNAT superfamily N-acetyltransferase